VKPRKEYVIVKTMGLRGLGVVDTYVMVRRYEAEKYTRNRKAEPDISKYVATGLSYKQAKRMMKLFKEN
jgi:hypothetical protein